jgi:hypothetical protein
MVTSAVWSARYLHKKLQVALSTSLKTLSRVVQSDVYPHLYDMERCSARPIRVQIVASAGTIYGLAQLATEIGDKTVAIFVPCR